MTGTTQTLPYRIDRDGLILAVRLTPKAARNSVDGPGVLSDGRAVILARVRAVPEKGAANAALEALLAEALGVGKSLVSVEGGATARLKQVRVAGDAGTLASRLHGVLHPWPGLNPASPSTASLNPPASGPRRPA